MSALPSRAPPRFAAWVAMVAGLVTAGKGHPARWLIAAHAADEKTLELVNTRYPAKAGPASESLSTVSLLRLLPEGHDEPQHYTACLAYLKRMDALTQQGLGLTVVHKRKDRRSHGGNDRKLEWIGPHPADGVGAHASPGDYLDGAPLGEVALCAGGDGQGRGAKRGRGMLPEKKHSIRIPVQKKACTVHKDATATTTTAAAGPAATQTKTNNPKRKSQEVHQDRHREAVLAPVEALLDGAHGAVPRSATGELKGSHKKDRVHARLEATVSVAAAMNGVARDVADPEEEKRAAAVLVLAAQQWGVSLASLIAAASPGKVAIDVSVEGLATELFRNAGWTMTTLDEHIKATDRLLNKLPDNKKRHSSRQPRLHDIPTLGDVRAHLLSLARPPIVRIKDAVPGSEPDVGVSSAAMDAKAYLEALLANPSTQASTHHDLFAGHNIILLIGMDGAQVTKSNNVSIILTTLGLLNQASLLHSVNAAPPLAICPVPESRGAISASLQATFGGLMRAGGKLEWPCPGPECAKCRAQDPPDSSGKHTATACPMYCLDMKALNLAFGVASNACPYCTHKISQLTNDRIIAPDFNPDAEFPIPTMSQRRAHSAAHAEALETWIAYAHPDPERRPTTINIEAFEASSQYTAWAKGAGREGLKSGGVLLDSITSMWQVTPDALHILLYIGRVVCQEVAKMMTTIEHDLAATHGTGIGYVMGIRALYLSGMTRAAYIMEMRWRHAATQSGKGCKLGSSEEGLPLDNRTVRPRPNPPLTATEAAARAGRYVEALAKRKATYQEHATAVGHTLAAGTLNSMGKELKRVLIKGMASIPRTVQDNEIASGNIVLHRKTHGALAAQAARIVANDVKPFNITAEQASTILADPKALGGDVITLLRHGGIEKIVGTLNSVKANATATLSQARRDTIAKLHKIEEERDQLLTKISTESDEGDIEALDGLEGEMENCESDLIKIAKDEELYLSEALVDPALKDSVDHLRKLEAMALPLYTGKTVDGATDEGDGGAHRERATEWFRALTKSLGSTKAIYAHVLAVEIPRYLDWLALTHPGLPFRCFSSQRAEHANKTNKKRMLVMLGSATGNRYTGETCFEFRIRHETTRNIWYGHTLPGTQLGKKHLKDLQSRR